MKNIILTSLIFGTAIIASTAASAAPKALKTQACPFQDTFSVQAPYGTQIKSLRTDGNVAVQAQDPVNFTVGCGDYNNSDGNIYVVIGNAHGQCQLTINDGPFMMNPIVTASSCVGSVQYNGMDHPFGSYQYTLKFS